MARPHKLAGYSYEEATELGLIDDVLQRLMQGEALKAICKDGPFHEGTFLSWALSHEELAKRYAYARTVQAHLNAERALTAALEATDPAMGRLHMDALRWYAGRMLPQVFGESNLLKLTNAIGDGDAVVRHEAQPLAQELLGLLSASRQRLEAPTTDATPPPRVIGSGSIAKTPPSKR